MSLNFTPAGLYEPCGSTVAQLVECRTLDQYIAGTNPTIGAVQCPELYTLFVVLEDFS